MAKKQAKKESHNWEQHGEFAGFENITQADLGIPFLQIIQPLSPEIDEESGKFIEGAEVGMIFNSVSREILGGADDAINVIPCNYQRMFVEWKPRKGGGGFVAAHKNESILEATHRNADGRDELATGNVIVTTAYMFCLYNDNYAGPVKCVISFSSTQLKKARQWLSMMMAIKFDGEKIKYTPPMFSHEYALTTVSESNESGRWCGWKIDNAGMLNDTELIVEASKFSKTAVSALAVRTALPEKSTEDETDTPF